MRDIHKYLVPTAVCWVLVFCCTNGFAQDEGARDRFLKIFDWSGYNLTTDLDDGTSLYSYIAESVSLDAAVESQSSETTSENSSEQIRAEHKLVMRFTFLPRFQCSPLIELIGSLPANTDSATRVATVQNFNQLSVSIDGEEFPFPALVEVKGDTIHSFLDADLQRRSSIRILVQLGIESIVTFGDGAQTRFSLIGSRDTIEQIMGRCRNHQ